MTQKELLYFEDAISHEQNLSSYIEFAIANIKDEKLVEFFEKELKNHEMLQSKLIAKLEESINE